MNRNTTFTSKKIHFRFFISVFVLCSFTCLAQIHKSNAPSIATRPSKSISPFQGNNTLTYNSDKDETPLTRLNEKSEDVGKRDLFSKHFKNNDGSYTAVIGSGPIHYLKNGGYKNIDTQITNNSSLQYPYVNKTNLIESYFGATANQGILSVSPEGSIKEFIGNKMYWEVSGQPVGMVSSSNASLSVSDNKAIYHGLFNHVDAAFTVLSGARKLNYILQNTSAIANAPAAAEYLVFSENIKLKNNWKYQNTPKGVQLTDEKGKVIYQYEKPVSHDAVSSGAFTNNSVMEIKLNGNVLTILTKVKAAWLLDSARVFPITIDPTSVYYPQNAVDASGQCFPDGGASGDIYAGYSAGWYRGWVTFNTAGLPACDVSLATVSLYPGAVLGTFDTTNAVFIGQSKYDLSSLYFFPAYDEVYNAITDSPTNSDGAYTQITSATAGSYMNFELGTFGRADIEAKAGGANSFFPISLSPSWGTGTTERIMGFYGYADAARRPYLTVIYTATDLYCHPTNLNANCAGYGDCEYIGISNVTLDIINNTTLYNNIPTGYNNYTSPNPIVNPEGNYTLNVTYKDNGAPVNPGNIAAWIDWNQDGTMAAADFLGNSGILVDNQTFVFNFNVPSDVPAGTTRLRIRSALAAEHMLSFTSSCNSLDYGETEDYSINVVIPPANDDCFGAENLTVGATFAENAELGTNEFATNSTGVSNPGCANYQGRDLWYTTTVPASGNVTLATGNETGSLLTDTGIAVYSGNCGALTLIACDDNSGSGNFSQIALTGRTAGEVLYIRVWGFANLISGPFQISAWDASLGTQNFNGSSIGLYPNPAHTELTIKSGLPINMIHIYSSVGKLIQSETAKTTINVSALPNGVYMIQMELGTGTVITEKFIKN